jgi:hypothetical protein
MIKVVEKQEQIIEFLDKNYHISEGYFLNRLDEHEWGFYVVETLINVFSYSKEICENTLKSWSLSLGFSEEEYAAACGARKLRATYTREMANDLAQYGIDVEQALINILSQELAKEIDTQILRELRGEIKKTDELLEVVECMGYTTTPQITDPVTFRSVKGFVTMGYNEIKHARANNTIW